MSRPERRPHRSAPRAARTVARYLAPAVPEVAELLGAAERVLVTCGRAEEDHADRTVRIAAAVDPCTLPLNAVVGPGLPVPLAGRTAFRALDRLAVALRPVVCPDQAPWVAGRRGELVAFRTLRIDTTDLAILGQAAARLTHPRTAREGALGALGAALAALRADHDEFPDHCHPAALGCLLAVLVPVVDPATEAVYATAEAVPAGAAAPVPVLDAPTLEAHREVGRRTVARLQRTR